MIIFFNKNINRCLHLEKPPNTVMSLIFFKNSRLSLKFEIESFFLLCFFPFSSFVFERKKLTLILQRVKQIKERIGEDKVGFFFLVLEPLLHFFKKLRAFSQDQPDALTLKVCEECGGIMVSNDSEDRIQSHLQGKHHLGFVRICETIKELKVFFSFLSCFSLFFFWWWLFNFYGRW